MGLTRYWQGTMGADRREWSVNVARHPVAPPETLDHDDPSGFLDVFVSVRTWVAASECPAFAAWAFDDDFAYIGVGADGHVFGVLLFDRQNVEAEDFYDVRVPEELLLPGAVGVAEWAKAYAPAWTGAGVMDAFAKEGGGPYGLMQLMRVLHIELPYQYTNDPPQALS